MQNVDYKIFVDESCHLENDHKPVMCVGQIKVPVSKYEELKNELKEIKLKHHTPYEIKWTSVSNSRLNLYKNLIDFFFDNDLTFRSVLVKYKSKLDHDQFNQGSHDNFYYKMIYYLLHNPYQSYNDKYAAYLDIKDTRGRQKLRKLHEIFKNKYLDESPFVHFQHIMSKESVFIQLVDLFIGAIAYKAQHLDEAPNANETKVEIINYLQEKSGYSLDEGTEPWEEKFNIFDHQPRKSV